MHEQLHLLILFRLVIMNQASDARRPYAHSSYCAKSWRKNAKERENYHFYSYSLVAYRSPHTNMYTIVFSIFNGI